jgi:hypothetical protein
VKLVYEPLGLDVCEVETITKCTLTSTCEAAVIGGSGLSEAGRMNQSLMLCEIRSVEWRSGI